MKRIPAYVWILLAIPAAIIGLGWLVVSAMNDPDNNGVALEVLGLVFAVGGVIFVVWLVRGLIAGGVEQGIKQSRRKKP